MTSTDLAVRAPAGLPEKIEYARFLAQSGLLPQSYRQQPANILFAYEYGELLGLHPMAAITGIHVIDGRPSISAGLMSALVRRAGHRIRVQSQGSGDQATARCQIIRSDDPGFTYAAVWTMERAKQAGLLSRTNWRNYPEAMLKARAVSECARDACQEVLLGMAYTPDELGADDDGGEVIHDGFPTQASGALALSQMTEDEKDAAGAMTRHQRVEHEALRRMGEPPPGAVETRSEADPDDPWAAPADRPTPAAPAAATARTDARAPAQTARSARPSKAATEKLQNLLRQIPLGPDEDVAALLAAWTGEPDPLNAELTAVAVKTVTTILESALEHADGNPELAASQIWDARKKADGDG